MGQVNKTNQESSTSGPKLYDTLLERLSSEWEWTQKNESCIMEPYTYITSNPGKDIRSQFIAAFNLWLAVPEEKTKAIAGVVNMLHSASLLIDDIQDNSQLRRGSPGNGAQDIWSTPDGQHSQLREEDAESQQGPDVDAIVTGTVPPFHFLARSANKHQLLDELLSLHRGQGLDLLWRDSLQCPTEGEYIGMVNNKTGGLLRIGIKLMMAMATANVGVDYVPLVNLIGVYFQIRDGLLNLSSANYATNKGFAEDLTEGKFSFPIVHGIWEDTENRQILNVLQKRPSSPTMKFHGINYLKNRTQSFQYTLGVPASLETQIQMDSSPWRERGS
ncbi:geranylgeranyl pyrophosphate synthetase [Moniliophthora roreri]|nr:geranylgeranyl pyrophosphate synthetase [Moniliophthora roreri]